MRYLPILALLVLGLSVACRSKPPAAPIHFARERIDLNIRPGQVEVFGRYYFKCSAAKPMNAGLFYPFPLDSVHGFPDSIAVPGRRFSPADSGVSFNMQFPARAEDSFAVYYRQPLRANLARYIVTTTRQWGRPLDQAWFRITVPAEFRDVKLSYTPDKTERTDCTVTYSFTRRSFYPAEDVIVTWR